MRSALAGVWTALAGSVVLPACVALARGAPHPALAALGSTFWVALGAGLAWWYARGVRATPSAARAPLWPALAPILAGMFPTVGAAVVASASRRPVALALTVLLALLALLAAWVAFRARAARRPGPLRTALLLAGLPATVLALPAPIYGLWKGFTGPVEVLALQGFGFGAIPGLWCAGAWWLSLGAAGPEPASPQPSLPSES